MSHILVRIGKGAFWFFAVLVLMTMCLAILLRFPTNRDAEGVEAARALAKPFKLSSDVVTVPIKLPADVVSSMTEIRTRETYGFLGGEYFYSFKLHSNDVERLVQCLRIERVKDMNPPKSPRLPPWWEAVVKQWPTNAICYYRDKEPYNIWYLPDNQQCLFHWFAH